MTRVSLFSSPLLLGFDDIEELLDRLTKSADDSYPPYNIQKRARPDGCEELQSILAVAGFSKSDLEIVVDGNHLTVRGKMANEAACDFLYRGIAGRQFQKSFLLADGLDVPGAELSHGLLNIAVVKPNAKQS